MANSPGPDKKEVISAKNTYISVLVALLRFLLGAVFIFSGFVKAIDPWGTVYKFNEYFTVLGLNDYIGLTSFIAMVVIISEFCLGIMTFTGIYRRLAPSCILLMMIVMLPLTMYLAVTDAVHDCGCFGDAVYLSNNATFIKNVFITVAAIVLLIFNKRLINYYGVAVQWLIVVASMIYVATVAFIGYYNQPMIDFMGFKVGTEILSDATATGDNIRFVYSDGAQERTFAIDSLPDDNSGWEFVRREEELNSGSPDDKPILSITVDGEDITSEVIGEHANTMLVLFPQLDDVEISYTFAINELYQFAIDHNIGFVALTAGNDSIVNRWRDLSMASYDIYNVDDSILKQIARGNPAIVYIENGIIKWKSSMQSIPLDKFEKFVGSLAELTNEYKIDHLYKYTFIFICFLIILLIINRTHRLPAINRFLERRYNKLIGEDPAASDGNERK